MSKTRQRPGRTVTANHTCKFFSVCIEYNGRVCHGLAARFWFFERFLRNALQRVCHVRAHQILTAVHMPCRSMTLQSTRQQKLVSTPFAVEFVKGSRVVF